MEGKAIQADESALSLFRTAQSILKCAERARSELERLRDWVHNPSRLIGASETGAEYLSAISRETRDLVALLTPEFVAALRDRHSGSDAACECAWRASADAYHALLSATEDLIVALAADVGMAWITWTLDCAESFREAMSLACRAVRALPREPAVRNSLIEAWCAHNCSAGEGVASGSVRRVKRMSLQEARRRAADLIRSEPDLARKPTQRGWASRIGCHPALVKKIPLFQSCVSAAERQDSPPGRHRKAVGLTEKLQQSIGIDDEVEEINDRLDDELQRLISEQNADEEPSPLDDRRQEVRARKIL